jgi:hypothetical protein
MDDFAIPLPSVSINEGIFDNPDGDPLGAEIQGALGALRQSVEGARAGALAHLSNETAPIPQRHLSAADFAYKAIRPGLTVAQRVLDKVAGEIKELQRKTAAPPPARDLIAGEIRLRLSQMTSTERMKTIMRTIKDGDDLLAASVLAGPPFLSGLSQAEFDQTRETWRRARLPQDCARIDTLQKWQTHLERGANLSLAFQMKCADQQVVAAAKANLERANAALAKATAGLMH